MQKSKLVQIEPYQGPSFDLTSAAERSRLSFQIKQDIDRYCQLAYDDGPRRHLGASEIGHKCERYLWYKFRWFFEEKFDGRQQRLFNRGHREESRFGEWLTGVGGRSLDSGEKQTRMESVAGHFGGSRDGIYAFSDRYGFEQKILVEFKTNGTGSGFDALAEGMQVAKPIHWAQQCTYGVGFELEYALYLNINKNDDSLYVEVLKLDLALGHAMLSKAHRIIVSPRPLEKLSERPSWYECKFCAARHVCHENATPLMNCRSCKYSSPVENGKWFCGRWQSEIPTDVELVGCAAYEVIK